ncbi:MAG: hypothetical protein WB564_04090 [Dehalococcoidia bacterium]
MASDFTTSCQEILKRELRTTCPDFEWDIEKRFKSSGKGWDSVKIDIYGENAGFVVCIEFEMQRRNPQFNAVKLFQLLEGSRDVHPFAGTKILIIHIFSPFYEVNPFFKQKRGCEVIMPGKFESIDVTYRTFRWNLDGFPEVRKACQVLPDSKNDFPPSAQLDEAISALAKDLGRIIGEWAS